MDDDVTATNSSNMMYIIDGLNVFGPDILQQVLFRAS
jgi:hypothetical protein